MANAGIDTLRVHVPLADRSYDIHIGSGTLAQLGEQVRPIADGGRVLVIADATVAEHYADTALASLQRAGVDAALASFPAGEMNKSLANADRLWQACAAEGIDRSGCICALGGGVTGDLAGFVAASWMRGIRFVQVPTSLLAMVDSSVGGKTGINSAAGKNLIGAFQQPSLVVIDTDVLVSMDAREYRAGLAEVAKYGVIRDADFLAWQEDHAAALVARDATAVAHAVATSCRIKAHYVVADEHEHGIRAHLNYGHTFGHALERDTGYTTYLHGEAVAIGMEMAIRAAVDLGLLTDDGLPDRQRRLLQAYDLPVRHRADDPAATVDRLVAACLLDKKARKGKARFVLPRRIGDIALVTDPDRQLIADAFAAAIDAAAS